MDEIEIICIVKDRDGLVSHCGVKGYGVQDILIIEKLIREEVVLFLSMKETKKRGMYMQELLQMENHFLQPIPMDLI